MDNTREKLIELLVNSPGLCTLSGKEEEFAENADWLIANGVTLDNQVSKWISVKERLPDLELSEAKADDFDLYACLATIKNKRARNGRYVGKAWYDGERFIDCDCLDITYDVTHWMPLPQPPKGGLIMANCKLGEKGCWKDGKCHYIHDCENKVLTHADRIRAMSDEELAGLLAHEVYRIGQPVFEYLGYGITEEVVYVKRLKWLQQPAGDDNG